MPKPINALSLTQFPPATFLSDLQTVDITLRILFRPDEVELPRIFKQYGMKYDDQILPSITTEVLKAVVVRSSVGTPD